MLHYEMAGLPSVSFEPPSTRLYRLGIDVPSIFQKREQQRLLSLFSPHTIFKGSEIDQHIKV